MARCRSSAGCQEEGTHGTYAAHFCETHYVEIRAICDAMTREGQAKRASAEGRKKKGRLTVQQKFDAVLAETAADTE